MKMSSPDSPHLQIPTSVTENNVTPETLLTMLPALQHKPTVRVVAQTPGTIHRQKARHPGTKGYS